MDESRMAWRKTFLVGLGFFGISLLWPVYDSFVPIFLDGFGLTSGVIGFLMTLDNYANLFILPTMGYLSDRTRSRWGRRYPFIIAGAPLAAVGAMLIPFAASLSLPLLIGAMLLMTLSMATFRSPAVALLGDFFSPAMRSRANGVINFMGLLAGILSFLIGGQLYKQGQFLPFVVAALTMLAVLALLIIVVREPAQPASPVTREEAPGTVAALALLRTLPRNTLTILAALAAWSVGITALQAFFTLFGRNELGLDPGTATQLLSFYPLGGLLFAIPGGYLGTYLGRRTTILLCLAATVAFLVIFLTIPAAALADASGFTLMNPATWFANPTIRLIVLLLLGVGAALTIITVNILPLLLDSAPAAQVGSYTGLYYLFGSVASILGPPLGGLLIDLTGDSYRTLFFFAPFWVLLGFVLMWLVREGQPAIAPQPSQAEA